MFSKFNHWITKCFLISLKLRNLKFHLKHFLTSASQDCSRYIRSPWRKHKKKYKTLQSSNIYRSCPPVVWFLERRERAAPRVLVAVTITQGQGRATCGSAKICASARWGQLSFTARSALKATEVTLLDVQIAWGWKTVRDILFGSQNRKLTERGDWGLFILVLIPFWAFVLNRDNHLCSIASYGFVTSASADKENKGMCARNSWSLIYHIRIHFLIVQFYFSQCTDVVTLSASGNYLE